MAGSEVAVTTRGGPFRIFRRVSGQARERYASDQELAARFRGLRADANRAESELRRAQHERRPPEELRERFTVLDRALAAVLSAAEAGERVAMGPRAYDDRIARRKALARDEVRHWTDEVDRLRTARETFRLEAMGTTGAEGTPGVGETPDSG